MTLWCLLDAKEKRGEARARDDLCHRRSIYFALYLPHLNMPTAVDDTEKSDSNSKCILIIATVAKKGSIVFVFAKAFPFIAFTALFLFFFSPPHSAFSHVESKEHENAFQRSF